MDALKSSIGEPIHVVGTVSKNSAFESEVAFSQHGGARCDRLLEVNSLDTVRLFVGL